MFNASSANLPIGNLIDDIGGTLAESLNLVIIAPPGAGKTTLVPLLVQNQSWCDGKKIIVLEPRRIAARAAAERMADLLGQEVGRKVGYRVRFDSKVSDETRIEVVTEGVFSRLLAQDPELTETGAVIFDEIHERSLDGDLALALCLDLQSALRPDLRLVAMSATLDGASVSKIMNAAVLESDGRSYPVDIVYKEHSSTTRIEEAVCSAVLEEMKRSCEGTILIFLPGKAEIERTADLLEPKAGDAFYLNRLYGSLSKDAQDKALFHNPKVPGRKVVLSSAIAETSLTIDQVTTVIDSGLSRQPVYDPATGFMRLKTVRASRASVDQRAGRAGRLGPGRAVRLWRREQTKALPKFNPPEILNTDLSALLLELADWGVSDPGQLKWLDEPSASLLAEARSTLVDLGAMTKEGKITPHGRLLRNLPLPPRLAHVVSVASRYSKSSAVKAAQLALLIQERGVGGDSLDLEERYNRLQSTNNHRARQIKNHANQMVRNIPISLKEEEQDQDTGVLLANGFTDRIAKRGAAAPNGNIRYKLSNGTGAELQSTAPLSDENFIVVIDLAGRAGAARVLSAARVNKEDIVTVFGDRINDRETFEFNLKQEKVEASRCRMLGHVMMDQPRPFKPSTEQINACILGAIKKHGLSLLPWSDTDKNLRDRLFFLFSTKGDPWPDVSEKALLSRLEEWVLPFLTGGSSLSQLSGGKLAAGLELLVGYSQFARVNVLLPTHFVAPSGSRIPYIYAEEGVVLRIRPQELFGLDIHPTVLSGEIPVEIELLSPAGRPIQITRDLPGFWRGSWSDVRSDLRGRYPKHPWPENPQASIPTNRVKPKKQS